MTPLPNAGLGVLILEVSGSHTHTPHHTTHTHTPHTHTPHHTTHTHHTHTHTHTHRGSANESEPKEKKGNALMLSSFAYKEMKWKLQQNYQHSVIHTI